MSPATDDDGLIRQGVSYNTADICHRRCSIWIGTTCGSVISTRLCQRIRVRDSLGIAVSHADIMSCSSNINRYIASTTFIKSSIGASLLRLANTKKWRYVLYFGMTIDFCAGIATFLYVLFTCSPVNYQWTAFNPATPKGHCLPAHGLAIVGYGKWTQQYKYT